MNADLQTCLLTAALSQADGCTHGIKPGLRLLLVTDLVEFTNLLDRTDDEYGRALIRVHNCIVRRCLRKYNGEESTHTGDGVIASFYAVDAALSCAVRLQQALEQQNRTGLLAPLRVRIGLHIGRPLVDETRLFGKCINTAVRLCSAATAEQIVASQEVVTAGALKRFRFSELGARSLKGLSTPISMYELHWRSKSVS